ncbi:MAG TPA: CAP domain-containing protein [Rhizomicrobium sp.]|nr:CAP domain-containing protein [Rhizomicrobium sp.]
MKRLVFPAPASIPGTILALLVLAGCAWNNPPAKTVPPNPASQMPALEMRIAVLVEEQRHKLDTKAKPLAIDPELSKVARERAADMAAKNYLAHAAPDGETSASLLMRDDAKWQGLLGENLAAQHYTKESGVAVDEFARRFLDEWMKSPPHRDNMAFPGYDHAGVGAAVNGDTVYVALLFSTDLGLPPPKPEGPASAVTRFDSPAQASAPPPPSAPLRLRGAEGVQ